MGFFEGLPFFGRKEKRLPPEATISREKLEKSIIPAMQMRVKLSVEGGFLNHEDMDPVVVERLASELANDVSQRMQQFVEWGFSPDLDAELRSKYGDEQEANSTRPYNLLRAYFKQAIRDYAPNVPVPEHIQKKREEKKDQNKRVSEFVEASAGELLEKMDELNSYESTNVSRDPRDINAQKLQHNVFEKPGISRGVYPSTEQSPAMVMDESYPQTQKIYTEFEGYLREREPRTGLSPSELIYEVNRFVAMHYGLKNPDKMIVAKMKGRKHVVAGIAGGNEALGLPPIVTPSIQAMIAGYIFEKASATQPSLHNVEIRIKRVQPIEGKGSHAYVELKDKKGGIRISDPALYQRMMSIQFRSETDPLSGVLSESKEMDKKAKREAPVTPNLKELYRLYSL